jgi:hypothetical protein
VTGTANHWYYPQNTHPFTGFDATYASSGIYNFWGYDLEATGDYAISKNANVNLPPASTPYLHFEHAYAFEDGNWDGGVIEYSVNGGAWIDAGALPAVNGYNGSIQAGSTNQLQGRPGFVNDSNGYISTRLNLSSLAGSNVRFRFRIGTDVTSWDWGWFIDDIRIYTCVATGPLIDVYVPQAIRGLPPQAPPAAPSNLVASATSSSAIHLAWSDIATNEDGYNLERSPNGSSWSPLIALPANSTSYDNTGLPASTPFHYRVNAYNGGGSSTYSNPASATTLPLSLPTTFNSVADATILQAYPTTNFGNTNDMYTGYDDLYDPDWQILRSLVKFDVSAIPQGTPISSAALNVYYSGYYDFPDYSRTVTAYHPASNWTELGVWWNNAPTSATAYGSVSIIANNSWRYVSIDVTDLVRGWVNGTISNHGIMLRSPEVSGSDSSWRQFYTREAGASLTPKLIVTYPAGVATTTSPEVGESLSKGQMVLQFLTGQAYDPFGARLCQPASDPQAPVKCVSVR